MNAPSWARSIRSTSVPPAVDAKLRFETRESRYGLEIANMSLGQSVGTDRMVELLEDQRGDDRFV